MGITWALTDFVMVNFFSLFAPNVMPVTRQVMAQYETSGIMDLLDARGIPVFEQNCANDEFFVAGMYQHDSIYNAARDHPKKSQRTYVNSNHYGINEVAFGSNIPSMIYMGRFSALTFAGHAYPRIDWSVDCVNDNDCEVTVAYSGLLPMHYPVHYPQTQQQALPEVWTAQSAGAGRDFRFLNAQQFGALQQGIDLGMQDVQFAPGALIPAGPMKNADMTVTQTGNVIWKYKLSAPDGKFTNTVIRVAFACPHDNSLKCEAGTEPILFPRNRPFSGVTCFNDIPNDPAACTHLSLLA